MKSLKQYIKEVSETSSSKFVAAVYTDETQEKLREYCKKYGFDLTKNYSGNPQSAEDFEFHTTIFYTKSKHIIPNGIQQKDRMEVIPTELTYFGENYDIPVLKVKSDSLQWFRKHYEDEYNMEDAWDSYKPHISLSYNRNTPNDLSKIPLPDFPLYFDKIKIDEGSEDV